MKLVPEQSPDWAYARNKRVVLMSPSAEWVQSVFSSTWVDPSGNHLIAPNRDYPYEGLLAYHAGENWKFLDCIALGLRDRDGHPLVLEADAEHGVRATPWRTTYCYRTTVLRDGAEVSVPLIATYYLSCLSTPDFVTAGFDVYCPIPADHLGLRLMIQPVVDIRHMYAGSDYDAYRTSRDGDRLHILYMNRRMTFHATGDVVMFDGPQRLEWSYKLGTGSRHEVEGDSGQMETWFMPEQREVASLFRLETSLAAPRTLTSMPFSCGLESSTPHRSFVEARDHLRRSRRTDGEDRRRIRTTFKLDPDLDPSFQEALHGRIVGLTKFKTYVREPETDTHVKVPHAGAWWFRTPWYRDVFEGLLSSLETLLRLPAERENLREIVLHALSTQHPETGLIQARVPEFAHHEPTYNSSDATLLCVLIASAYARATSDVAFVNEALPCALAAIASFRDNYQERPGNGPPRVHPETGLLLSVPHHSWIDTQSQCVQYAGSTIEHVPNRVSERFVKDLYDAFGDEETVRALLFTASFFLPEINAQWILMLRGVLDMASRVDASTAGGAMPISPDEVAALLARAEGHFKRVFWNERNQFLFNVVEERQELRDEIECEAAVTSAAMLERTVFTDEDLHAIWHWAQPHLLVNRCLQRFGSETTPFGLLTRNDDKRIYYNDDQYHSDVTWPRSTVYLVKLLGILGDEATARQLLVNMLDHQMTEAAIFYNQEVLSKPCGNNPNPDKATRYNPVPVKNPIQFWSQWCDAFLDQYEVKAE